MIKKKQVSENKGWTTCIIILMYYTYTIRSMAENLTLKSSLVCWLWYCRVICEWLATGREQERSINLLHDGLMLSLTPTAWIYCDLKQCLWMYSTLLPCAACLYQYLTAHKSRYKPETVLTIMALLISLVVNYDISSTSVCRYYTLFLNPQC